MAIMSRPLRRTINTDVAQPEVPTPTVTPKRPTAEMKAKAVTFFVENGKANDAKGVADKARKSLFQLMQDADVPSFEHKFTNGDGVEVPLEVSVDTPDTQSVDVAKLYKVMNCAKDPKQLAAFLAIVSATKKSVTDALGTATFNQVSVPGKGTTNVNVKVKK